MRRTQHVEAEASIAFCDHNHPAYRRRWVNVSDNRFNGAFFYSKEIVKNIIPNVKTSRPWITVNVPGIGCDRAIVFVHNNLHPENYEHLRKYKDLILVCGIPETCELVNHLGKAVYLPLSIDVEDVSRYKVDQKTKDVCYVGRRAKRLGVPFPAGVDFLENMPRAQLLAKLAEYRQAYAVGRAALEAKALGCEILPYDERFPDPERWMVLDNREAAEMLQEILWEFDGKENE